MPAPVAAGATATARPLAPHSATPLEEPQSAPPLPLLTLDCIISALADILRRCPHITDLSASGMDAACIGVAAQACPNLRPLLGLRQTVAVGGCGTCSSFGARHGRACIYLASGDHAFTQHCSGRGNREPL